jgi:hypothetical protein
VWNWSTLGKPAGNYSAVSLGTKTSYNDVYDYFWFEILSDNTAPVITLITPLNNNYTTSVNITFYYNVTDPDSSIANCSLIINNSIINTTNDPIRNITLNFTTNLSESLSIWQVNCTDINGNINTSGIRNITLDTTGPVSALDRPQNDSFINAIAIGFIYAVNASVTDSGIGNISVVTFMYRVNNTDTWKLACRDNDSTAPYQCNWNLTGLTSGEDYEVRVYANDTLGKIGGNSTHVNITITTSNISISLVRVDDDVGIPVYEMDLQAGTIKAVYCNMTVIESEAYTNILGVNATLYSITTTYDAADDNRTHYSNSSCTFLTGGGPSADYQCVFNLWHFAINGSWNCSAFAWNSYSVANAIGNTTVNQLFALNISTSIINYTALQPNETSPNITVNINNVGNMPMNISVYGFGGDNATTGAGLSMICEINNISVAFERYSTDSNMDYAAKNQLSSALQDIGLTMPVKTNASDARTNSTYWQFMVPPEAHSFGQCNGSVVFVAEAP